MPERSYRVYLHSTKESMRAAAVEAGYTDEQIDRLGLAYVGYEEAFEVTVVNPEGGDRGVFVRHIKP